MDTKSQKDIREKVRKKYARAAAAQGCGCTPGGSCCGSTQHTSDLGYTLEELSVSSSASDMSLGCGNPHAISRLQEGQTVLDLGSGGGFDCFLASKAVGEKGSVIGVDMTEEMIQKARVHAAEAGIKNVEFRLGEIEHLPVEDESVDVIISNCVINLSPDKQQVLREAFRVLKPGGRLAVSDIITTAKLPEDIEASLACYTGCVSGALPASQLEGLLTHAGFTDVSIAPKPESAEFIQYWVPGRHIEDYIRSADITARKP
jgi:2-polyprenyl-3-methyl-5-hydroxy-6-metoxy-1,4-benzoquinol methylase